MKHARLATLLVLIMMTICLSQRAGFHVSCPSKVQDAELQSLSLVSSKQGSGFAKLELAKCDTTEHLLQSHNNAIDFVMLFIALILGRLYFYPTLSNKLTRLGFSRAPPRPLFLMFCNFRE